jgi:hypothetical protein
MNKYVTNQSVAAAARIAVLCVLAFVLGVGFSPAFAAALSRGADIRTMLSAARTMIRSFCARRNYWSPFARALFYGSNHFPFMIAGSKTT